MTGPDDEFDDFLTRRKPVFRRTSDDPLEPPAELDRLILSRAREAISAEPPQRVFRAPRWGMPVALAATLMLAVTVVMHVGSQKPAAAPTVALRSISREIPDPAAAPPSAPAMESASPASSAADAAYALHDESATDGPIVVDLSSPMSDKQEQARHEPARRARAAEVYANTAQPAPAAPPAGFVSEQEAARYAPPPEAGSGSRTLAREVPAPASGVVVNGARAEATSTGELRTDTAAVKAAADAPAYRRDSKTWMAEIERLRAAGDVARAEAELEEYKRAHRAYAVSPDR